MQVMNAEQFSQTEVLVGQSSKTRSFGVSDDPMLMSMLSTGFYKTPLRTMIQEVMFNAWDAHRMANCQNRPIEIYINETTGLIFRDYGPGIDPGPDDDNMHEIYCVYGASTKRKMKNQTGGFGLGSKSPFAYTESFTVTSHYQGVKNMYLISRVSDNNGGKPGMTSLVRVPTTDTGLMVTIPLKSGDMTRAYEHIKDILYLSGIKAMIYYEDSDPEFIQGKQMSPGEYITDSGRHGHGIYAVYGGVRYEIPDDEDYTQEFRFMRMVSKSQNLYIGFAPDTLTPLPSREGLNVGDKAKESIRATLELCMEKFQMVFEPLTHAFFRAVFTKFKDEGFQGVFAMYKAYQYGYEKHVREFSDHIMKSLLPMVPYQTDEAVWKIGVKLLIEETTAIRKLVGADRWNAILLARYCEIFPDDRYVAYAIRREGGRVDDDFFIDLTKERTMRPLHLFEREMKAKFKDDSLHPILRVHQDSWLAPIRQRTKAHLNKDDWSYKEEMKKPKGEIHPRYIRKDSFDSYLELYMRKSGESHGLMLLEKTVIIAKTLEMLNNVRIPLRVTRHSGFAQNGYYDRILPVPGYVIHSRKGAYDEAVKILTNLGFDIIEADEPEKRVYKPKEKTEAPVYPLLQPTQSDDWCSRSKFIPDPTHYFYATMGDLKNYGGHSRPSGPMVHWFMQMHPKTVMLNNSRTAQIFEKNGVKHIIPSIIDWYNTTMKGTDRMVNMVRASMIRKLSPFDGELLNQPLIQLELGMEPVDPSDVHFWRDAQGIQQILDCAMYDFSKFRKEVESEVEKLWMKDPEQKNILKMTKASKAVNGSFVSYLWSSTPPSKRDEMVDKIVLAIKMFA